MQGMGQNLSVCSSNGAEGGLEKTEMVKENEPVLKWETNPEVSVFSAVQFIPHPH